MWFYGILYTITVPKLHPIIFIQLHNSFVMNLQALLRNSSFETTIIMFVGQKAYYVYRYINIIKFIYMIFIPKLSKIGPKFWLFTNKI